MIGSYLRANGKKLIIAGAFAAARMETLLFKDELDQAAKFLVDEQKRITRVKAQETIVPGMGEVCGSCMRKMAQMAFYNPGLFGHTIYFMGGRKPADRFFFDHFQKLEASVGIKSPRPGEIESEAMCRIYAQEFNALCQSLDKTRSAATEFTLVTARTFGLKDEGLHAQDNMRLAIELMRHKRQGTFPECLGIAGLSYEWFRNAGTFVKTYADCRVGPLPILTPSFLYPVSIGITESNYRDNAFVGHLILDEYAKAGPNGRYAAFFTPIDIEKFDRRNRAYAERNPDTRLTRPGPVVK